MTHSFTLAIADYFKAHQGEWIDGMTLSGIGGQYAWRSRVADARKLGLQIENRQRRKKVPSGQTIVISEYRYVSVPVQQADLFAESARNAVRAEAS